MEFLAMFFGLNDQYSNAKRYSANSFRQEQFALYW